MILRLLGGWRTIIGATAALALVGLLWGLYAKGRADGKEACELRHAAALAAANERVRDSERRAAEIVSEIDRSLAHRLANLKIEHTTINRTIRDEVREVPIYSECRISERLFDDLNRLRAATDPGPVR